MELDYFQQDVIRTADFLGLPYDDPEPSPVNWIEGSGWVAGPDQGRVGRLYNLLYEAHLLSKEYPVYAALMRLIWSGQTSGWDEELHLIGCLESCGLADRLIDQPDVLTPEAECYFASNQQAMFDCGHWGVPMLSWCGEPFYGQDRLDQLRWKIEKSIR
jgi:2-hydroxychromene-2-carboxylate isomerase